MLSVAATRRGAGERRTDSRGHDSSDTSESNDEGGGDSALRVGEDVVGRVGEDGGNVGWRGSIESVWYAE